MAKKEVKTDMMDLDQVRGIVSDQVEDLMYSIPRTKSPKIKRAKLHSLSFWSSMAYFLQMVDTMSDDEFLSLEEKMKEVSNG